MVANIQKNIEFVMLLNIILFIDPLSIIGLSKLILNTVLVFGISVALKAFIARPLTRFFNSLKRKQNKNENKF